MLLCRYPRFVFVCSWLFGGVCVWSGYVGVFVFRCVFGVWCHDWFYVCGRFVFRCLTLAVVVWLLCVGAMTIFGVYVSVRWVGQWLFLYVCLYVSVVYTMVACMVPTLRRVGNGLPCVWSALSGR